MTQGCLKRRNLFLYSTNQRSIFDLDQKHVLWFPGLEPEEDVREGGGLLRVHGARVDASGILGGKHPRETKRWKVKKHFQKLWYLFLLKVSSRSKTMEGEKQTDHYYTFPSLSLKCSSTNSCCCRLVNTLTGESLHCCNIGRWPCVGKYWLKILTWIKRVISRRLSFKQQPKKQHQINLLYLL